MITKAYKAVHVNPDGSFSSLGGTKEAEIHYQPNEWISTKKWLADKGYFLCCFDSIENIKKSIAPYALSTYVAVSECEMKGIIDNIPSMAAVYHVTPDDFRLSKNCWPEGTLMARQVRLTKRIEV